VSDQRREYITDEGYRKLREELDQLFRVERPRIVRGVADAAAEGDRSENAEYIYGKKKLREIDKRMRWLTQRIDAARVVKVEAQPGKEDRIFFGCTVTLEDEDGETVSYQLVGVDEIDLPKHKISWRSPIGQALLGKRLDDDVRVQTPAGVRKFTVAEVEYKSSRRFPALSAALGSWYAFVALRDERPKACARRPGFLYFQRRQ
jgi:transcription elongation factor GreB